MEKLDMKDLEKAFETIEKFKEHGYSAIIEAMSEEHESREPSPQMLKCELEQLIVRMDRYCGFNHIRHPHASDLRPHDPFWIDDMIHRLKQAGQILQGTHYGLDDEIQAYL